MKVNIHKSILFLFYILITSCSTHSLNEIEKIKFEIIPNDIHPHYIITQEDIRNYKIGDKIIWENYYKNITIKLGKKIRKVQYFDTLGIYYIQYKDKQSDTLLMDAYGRILYKSGFYKGSEETIHKLRRGIINFPSETMIKIMKSKYEN